jgi:hypothetical protein
MTRLSLESAIFTPTGVDYDVKTNQSTIFDKIAVATKTTLLNTAGNDDSITVKLVAANENAQRPVELGAGQGVDIIDYPIKNILITPGASFGVADKITVIIQA